MPYHTKIKIIEPPVQLLVQGRPIASYEKTIGGINATLATEPAPADAAYDESKYVLSTEERSEFESLLKAHGARVDIEPTWPRGQCRVDGVESPRHRADAATESTSRRWRGAPEI